MKDIKDHTNTKVYTEKSNVKGIKIEQKGGSFRDFFNAVKDAAEKIDTQQKNNKQCIENIEQELNEYSRKVVCECNSITDINKVSELIFNRQRIIKGLPISEPKKTEFIENCDDMLKELEYTQKTINSSVGSTAQNQ